MTADKTQGEGNRLIAEFMSGKYYDAWENDLYHHSDPYWYFESGEYLSDKVKKELLYHSSWDWLMPVCQKINSKESILLMEMNGVKDSITPYINATRLMKKGAINFDLQKTWDGVIQFIQWYNTNSK